MTISEYSKFLAQATALKKAAEEYFERNLEDIIQQMETREGVNNKIYYRKN